MKLKHLLLGSAFALCACAANATDWFLIGPCCDWSWDEAVQFTEVSPDEKYTATIESLQGQFEFATPDWEQMLTSPYPEDFDINGNCTLDLKPTWNGNLFYAPNPLKNVTITLDLKLNQITFSGLPNDLVILTEPEIVEADIPFFYTYWPADLYENDKAPKGIKMTCVEENIYQYSTSFDPRYQFVITKGSFKFPLDWDADKKWEFLRNYEYGPLSQTEEYPVTIKAGEIVNLKYPANCNAAWEIGETKGYYDLTINTADNTLVLKSPDWDDLYICGNVQNISTDIINDFKNPNESNREFYDENFKLSKRIIDGKEYFRGTFRLVPRVEVLPDPDEAEGRYYDYFPSFRFFRALLGWTRDASIGSAYDDFYILPVYLQDEKASFTYVTEGLGNWGFPIDETTPIEEREIEITVDLQGGMVYFGHYDFNGIDEIANDGNQQPEIWFNTQGVRVSHPGKGLYIRVSGNKTEKVAR